jgi:hypothetical protein
MTNPTSNFGWQMPTSTDLVTDLPADFEVFGQAVDTSLADLKGGTTGQVLKKNSNTDMDFVWGADSAGMTNPMTTTGDTIYSSSGSTPARLGIGSTGQVLTVSSGLPSWAAPAVSGANWSLLNAGGTALTAASTITVSGISGKDKIMVLIDNASGVSAECTVSIRFNADSGTNYYRYGYYNYIGSTYVASNFSKLSSSSSSIVLGKTSTDAASQLAGYCLVTGANSSGVKVYNSVGQGSAGSGSDHTGYALGGYYDSSSTISSVSVIGGSNFDTGTIFVYTSA